MTTVAATAAADTRVLVRAPDVSLLGVYDGSGYENGRFLVQRGDGQLVQLTPYLYGLLELVETPAAIDDIAAVWTTKLGTDVSTTDVTTLADRLTDAGLLLADDDTAPPIEQAVPLEDQKRVNPILTLGLRRTVLPPRAVNVLARPMRHAFHPPAIVAVLLAVVISDLWAAANGSLVDGLLQAISAPLTASLLILAVFASGIVHEFGHAAGCIYGGGRPGRIGIGVYVIYPAFFTDVTDVYRLPRRARIRTDLGGVYFTSFAILATVGAFALTGWSPLLLLLVALHVTAAEQFLPFIRQDGYFLLGDVAGIPDLFARLGPVLRSAIPGRPVHPAVADMRRSTRRIMTVWVLMVVPFLAVNIALALYLAPHAIQGAFKSVHTHVSALHDAVSPFDFGALLYHGLSLMLLTLSVAGVGILLIRIGRTVPRKLARRQARRASPQSRQTHIGG
jgi:putative peptide zinc metalloprotease protein